MTTAHAAQVLDIYRLGIDEGDATFETRAPAWSAFDSARLTDHRFVALRAEGSCAGAGAEPGAEAGAGARAETGAGARAGKVLGWVAVSKVSDRCAYVGVVEHSVYVHPAARGQGVARALLDRLVVSTEAAGIWTIQSGIFPENTASLALHQSAGFRVIGTRERIGRHHGVWRDVVLVERRSPNIV
ncbi:GNAT family N-acetyltransferase [Streptomyces sp. NPDC091376]|uniref:GNAT family N-acetyltransferase n=1 Tax=Streptomyces sp. NPDC091376 TaxID=3365994 RepID=UPI0037FF8489